MPAARARSSARLGSRHSLDPRISGSIIFTAKDKPFDDVVKRIAEISGLRYKFDDDVLRVELDTPFSKTYKIDYLNYVRKSTSSVDNNISVATDQGAKTGSSFEAASQSENDFWTELSTNLTQILGVDQSEGNMKTSSKLPLSPRTRHLSSLLP